MKHTKPWLGVLAVLFSISLVAAGCGDSGDDSGDSEGDSTETTVEAARSDTCRILEYEEVEEGGEFTDYAQLSSAGDNTSFDPQAVQTLDESQITQNLFDGLTDFDFTDTCNPKLEGRVAESWEANEDATEFTFKIREGEKFSNGEDVLPSNFKIAWERGGSPELASPYSYLVANIEGGQALLDGEVTELESVVADDEELTLTVTLAAPNADFPQIVSFPLFSPISKTDYEKIGNTTGWGTAGITIGNGPFKLESAGTADTGEVVLVRNDEWGGNVLGDTRATLDKITFMLTQKVDSAYQAFESGEGDNATIPGGRYAEARAKFPNTVDAAVLGTYFFDFGFTDSVLSGDENLKLRQAISLAIDRDEVNQKAYEGARVVSTGITPPGIPGFKADLCDYCNTDAAQAKTLYDEWVTDGGTLDGPLKVSFNTGGGHENVVAVMQANLQSVLGIDVELNPIDQDYFKVIAEEGACQICRSGWYADYPTYGNFMVDLFAQISIGGNNLGRYDDPEFEQLIEDAQKETDETKRGELYASAEERLLNESVAAIPLNWYTGDQVYRDSVVNYVQQPLGIFLWERIGKKSA